MKYKIIVYILIILLLFISILYINKETTINKEPSTEISFKKQVLGYCPTMEKDALLLSKDKNFSLVKYNSSKEVLNALNNKKIDKGLIGRLAKESKINSNISLEILDSGYTLISKNKNFIEFSKLPLIKVHTYLSKEVVSNNFNYLDIEYFDNKSKILSLIEDNQVILISWEDFKDDFELLVVLDDNNLKVKDFRGKFLYSY